MKKLLANYIFLIRPFVYQIYVHDVIKTKKYLYVFFLYLVFDNGIHFFLIVGIIKHKSQTPSQIGFIII